MCRVFFFFGWNVASAYLVSYCFLVRQQKRFEHPTLQQTSVLLFGCIKNSTISSKRVHCCINKNTNRGHNLHGRVVKKKEKTKMKTRNIYKNKGVPGFELTRDIPPWAWRLKKRKTQKWKHKTAARTRQDHSRGYAVHHRTPPRLPDASSASHVDNKKENTDMWVVCCQKKKGGN